MLIILGLIGVVIFVNYFLGAKLYTLPKDEKYFNNVGHYNIINLKDIMAEPTYVISLSVAGGIMCGLFIGLVELLNQSQWISIGFIILIFSFYLSEITKKISITEDSLVLSKVFSPVIKIPLNEIEGMYIYSYNKRFLKKHAFTTKLVVCTAKQKYKYTISSLSKKAILNMMSDNFRITENKMYIANEK